MKYWKYLFKNSQVLWFFSILTLVAAFLITDTREALIWTAIVAFVNVVNLIGNYFSHKKAGL